MYVAWKGLWITEELLVACSIKPTHIGLSQHCVFCLTHNIFGIWPSAVIRQKIEIQIYSLGLVDLANLYLHARE